MPLDQSKVAQFQNYLDKQKDGDLAASIAYARQGDGSQFRRADIAATQSGLPFSIAAQDVDRAESLLNPEEAVDVTRLRTDHPRTAEWMSDPRRAAISWDDRELLKKLEDNDKINTPVNLAKHIGTSVSTVAGNLMEAGGRAVADFEDYLREKGVPTPGVVWKDGRLQWVNDYSREEHGAFIQNVGEWASEGAPQYWNAESEFSLERLKADPTNPVNVLGFIAETTAASSADMALAMAGPAGAPLLAIATSERLAEERAKNLGESEIHTLDLLKTLPAGLVTAYMERYATRGLLGRLADQTKIDKLTPGVVATELGRAFVRESFTENVQEQIEYATEVLGTPVDWTKEEALDRSIAATVAGGGLGIGGRSLSLPAQMVKQRVQRDVENTVRSIMDQQGIDETINTLRESKLFQESPERAAEFLRGLEGDNNVFINPDEILAAADEGFNVPSYLVDAASAGELFDVPTTVDKFALDIVTDEKLLERLRPHIKRNPEGMTMQEIQDRDVSAIDRVLAKARTTQEIKEETDAIETSIVNQLVSTGRMDQTNARRSAAPLVAYIATKTAELRGRGIEVTPEDIMATMNFKIEKAPTAKGKKKAPLRSTNPSEVLDQNVNSSPLIGPDTDVTVGVTPDGQSVQENANPRIRMHFKEVTKRIPELTQAAQKVKDGTMSAAEYARLVNQYKPVSPYAEPPVPNTEAEITSALASNKRDRVGAPRNLSEGHQVGVRLDIPAYTNHGVWAVSVHEAASGFKAGKVVGYDQVALVNNAKLGAHEGVSMSIAAGQAKSTIAVVKGAWQNISAQEAQDLAKQAIASPEWVQVGYDPERHSYFYDRRTMAPVIEGDQVLQVGPLTLVKNPVYGDPDAFLYQDEVVDLEGELSAMEQLLACTRAA